MGDSWLTRQQVAELLAVHVRTVDGLIERGELRAVHVGSVVRIPREAVTEFERRNSGCVAYA